ncbi:MAG: dihydroneopterin aldolase [Bacteroidota bacterium]
MGTIILEGMEFYAYHGVYKEEQKIGNRYEVTLSVQTDFSDGAASDNISGTIDYGGLYQIVSAVMLHPTKLLERLGQQIIDEIRQRYPYAGKVEVKVSKHNPPIGGVCAKSTIIIQSED